MKDPTLEDMDESQIKVERIPEDSASVGWEVPFNGRDPAVVLAGMLTFSRQALLTRRLNSTPILTRRAGEPALRK